MNENKRQPGYEGKCKRGNENGIISSEEHMTKTRALTRAFAHSTSSAHNYISASTRWIEEPQVETCLSMSDSGRSHELYLKVIQQLSAI
jgi:hypothetical protein